MGIFDKIKDTLGVNDEDEDILEEEEFMPAKKERAERPSYDDNRKNNQIVKIHATTQLQVVLVKPERFDDASAIADHLNNKKTVVLNLESTNKDVSRRLVDFLSGVAYANKGQIKRVANSTFIITPYNVDILGDVLDGFNPDSFEF